MPTMIKATMATGQRKAVTAAVALPTPAPAPKAASNSGTVQQAQAATAAPMLDTADPTVDLLTVANLVMGVDSL